MKTIWKYSISNAKVTGNLFAVEMQAHAKVLSVGVINEEVFVWAEVDSEEKEKWIKKFLVYGTGHDIGENEIENGMYEDKTLLLDFTVFNGKKGVTALWRKKFIGTVFVTKPLLMGFEMPTLVFHIYELYE